MADGAGIFPEDFAVFSSLGETQSSGEQNLPFVLFDNPEQTEVFIEKNRILDPSLPEVQRQSEAMQSLAEKLLGDRFNPEKHQFLFLFSDDPNVNGGIYTTHTPPVIVTSLGMFEGAQSIDEIAAYLEHELGHLYAYEEFGERKGRDGSNSKAEEAAADGYSFKGLLDADFSNHGIDQLLERVNSGGIVNPFHAFDVHPLTHNRLSMMSKAEVGFAREGYPVGRPLTDIPSELKHGLDGISFVSRLPLSPEEIEAQAKEAALKQLEQSFEERKQTADFYGMDTIDRLDWIANYAEEVGANWLDYDDNGTLDLARSQILKTVDGIITNRRNSAEIEASHNTYDRINQTGIMKGGDENITKSFEYRLYKAFLNKTHTRYEPISNDHTFYKLPAIGMLRELQPAADAFLNAKTPEEAEEYAIKLNEVYDQSAKHITSFRRHGLIRYIDLKGVTVPSEDRIAKLGDDASLALPVSEHLQWIQETGSSEMIKAVSVLGFDELVNKFTDHGYSGQRVEPAFTTTSKQWHRLKRWDIPTDVDYKYAENIVLNDQFHLQKKPEVTPEAAAQPVRFPDPLPSNLNSEELREVYTPEEIVYLVEEHAARRVAWEKEILAQGVDWSLLENGNYYEFGRIYGDALTPIISAEQIEHPFAAEVVQRLREGSENPKQGYRPEPSRIFGDLRINQSNPAFINAYPYYARLGIDPDEPLLTLQREWNIYHGEDANYRVTDVFQRSSPTDESHLAFTREDKISNSILADEHKATDLAHKIYERQESYRKALKTGDYSSYSPSLWWVLSYNGNIGELSETNTARVLLANQIREYIDFELQRTLEKPLSDRAIDTIRSVGKSISSVDAATGKSLAVAGILINDLTAHAPVIEGLSIADAVRLNSKILELPANELLTLMNDWWGQARIATFEYSIEHSFRPMSLQEKSEFIQEMSIYGAPDIAEQLISITLDEISEISDPLVREQQTLDLISYKGKTPRDNVLPTKHITISSPEQRTQVAALITGGVVAEMGVDDGSPAYADTMRNRIHGLLGKTIGLMRLNLMEALANELNFQVELSEYIEQKLPRDAFVEASRSDSSFRMGEFLFELSKDDYMKEDVINYIINPHNRSRVDAVHAKVADRHLGTLNKIVGNDERLGALAKGFDTPTGRDTFAATLGNFHENFWNAPVAARAVFMNDFLFDPNTSTEDRAYITNQILDRATGVSTEDISFRRIRLREERDRAQERYDRAYENPEKREVRDALRAIFQEMRAERISGMLDINGSLPRFGRTLSEAELSRLTLESYLSVVKPAEAELLASGLLTANMEAELSGQRSIGRTIYAVLSTAGPAGFSVLQKIHSHPDTPADIKADISNAGNDVKTMADLPYRWQAVRWAVDAGITDPNNPSYSPYLGRVVGGGKFGVTMFNEGEDRTQYADTLLRPRAATKASREFGLMLETARIVSAHDPRMSVVLDMIQDAERSAKIETRMDLAAIQNDVAMQVYDGLKINIRQEDGSVVTFEHRAADLPHHSQEHKRAEFVHGNHFNDEEFRAFHATHIKNTAMAMVASQLMLRFAGLPLDEDRHGGNIKVEGDIIHHFDFGAQRALLPTDEQNQVLGKVVAQAVKDVGLGRGDFSSSLVKRIDALTTNTEVKSYLAGFKTDILALGDYINPPEKDAPPILDTQSLTSILGMSIYGDHTSPVVRAAFDSELGMARNRVQNELKNAADNIQISFEGVQEPEKFVEPTLSEQDKELFTGEAINRTKPLSEYVLKNSNFAKNYIPDLNRNKPKVKKWLSKLFNAKNQNETRPVEFKQTESIVEQDKIQELLPHQVGSKSSAQTFTDKPKDTWSRLTHLTKKDAKKRACLEDGDFKSDRTAIPTTYGKG